MTPRPWWPLPEGHLLHLQFQQAARTLLLAPVVLPCAGDRPWHVNACTQRDHPSPLCLPGVRGELDVHKGDLPAFEVTAPGMSVTTIDVPSVQNKMGWHNLLQLLTLADGMVVLRPHDVPEYDPDSYLANSPLLSEFFEIIDSRPMFIVCVCKGPIRSSMMAFPAMAQLVLATKDASFGFPDYRHDLHPSISASLRKRLTTQVERRLRLVGNTIPANEAQRLGLVDFVGDEVAVENEVCRLIYRNCVPVTTYYMYKTDMAKAMETKEALEDMA